MARNVFKPEQSINRLREAEVLSCQTSTVGEASVWFASTEQTYYRWRTGTHSILLRRMLTRIHLQTVGEEVR